MGKHKKSKTRAEMLLSGYKDFLSIWYGDNEEAIAEFGQWLIEQDRVDDDSVFDSLLEEDAKDESIKVAKKLGKKYESLDDCIVGIESRHYYIQDIKKKKKLKHKLKHTDLGLATYTNSKRYRKACLNNDNYRKYLKKQAKQERKELDEMRQQGYIRSKDPDKELAKLMKANSYMSEALSDSYTQKYFIK